jgi:hypothetical protein
MDLQMGWGFKFAIEGVLPRLPQMAGSTREQARLALTAAA